MDLMEKTRKNPFFVLSASPADSRETLLRKQRDMELFGEAEEAERALNALLNPQRRLEAELRWFPGTGEAEIQRLMQEIGPARAWEPIPNFGTESFLAHFNALRLQLLVFPLQRAEDLEAMLHALSFAADCLLPEQVMEELNGDRKKAGVPLLEKRIEVESGLSDLLRETVLAYLELLPPGVPKRERKDLSDRLIKEMRDKKSPYHNSYFLDLASVEIGAGL